MSDIFHLWHADGTRSLRVLWTIEELGLRDRTHVHTTTFPPRVHDPKYLDINPLGSLPFFKHGDVQMSESLAICRYLAEVRPDASLVVRPDEAGWADYLQLTSYGEATLMPLVAVFVSELFLTPSISQSRSKLGEAREEFRDRQHALVAYLRSDGPLVAGRTTLADISIGYALGLVELLGQAELFSPEVAAYLHRLQKLPAHIRAYTGVT